MDSSPHPHSVISGAGDGANTRPSANTPSNAEFAQLGPGIPTYSSAPADLRCCCGRPDCALLEHNSVALEGLEKDLATAARLGQVR